MSNAFTTLSPAAKEWLADRAHARGTDWEIEASELLDQVIRERMQREDLLRRIDRARHRPLHGPMTAQDIENAINWGRA